jgi:GNAT superfamily N-acetyltransferase
MNMATIETASCEDIFQLTELLSVLFTQEADFIADHAKQARALKLIIGNPQVGRILVVREGNEVIGMVNLLNTVSTAEGGFVLVLEDLIIKAGYRGKGIGSALLRHAIDFGKANGFVRMTLLTDRMNETASRFYGKHGFDISEMTPMRLILG